MIKAIIVDDEPFAHKVLKYHIARHSDITLVGQLNNATEALKWLANNSADLVFLDVNMPELTGIEMLKVSSQKIHVVIVSAHQEYALDGFELDVVDYLLKPVDDERFDKAIGKLKTRINAHFSKQKTISIKQERGFKVIDLSEITYIQGYGNYVKVWQGRQMDLANSTLKSILFELPPEQFIQVSKSAIINMDKISEVNVKGVTLSCGSSIKISRRYVKDLRSLLPQ